MWILWLRMWREIGSEEDGRVSSPRWKTDVSFFEAELTAVSRTQTWLPDAARAGAKFMTAFKVEKILFSDTSRSKATGITGTWSNSTTPITLNASRIIVSSGSLNSPVLLLRSGLSSKIPTIGHNLHLHPVTQVWGEMDSITDPMEGSPLTTIITEFENLDGEGHGFKIETPLMTLEGIGPAMPWRGSEEWKQVSTKELQLTRLANEASVGSRRIPKNVKSIPTSARHSSRARRARPRWWSKSCLYPKCQRSRNDVSRCRSLRKNPLRHRRSQNLRTRSWISCFYPAFYS